MSMSPIDREFHDNLVRLDGDAKVTSIKAARVSALFGGTDEQVEPPDVITAAPNAELARLANIQARNGVVPAVEYEKASKLLGIGARQIQRQLKALRAVDAAPAGRRPFELSQHHKQVIMACCGNVALAYRQLLAAGEDLPGEDSVWRAWFRQPTAMQAYARKGAKGLVEFYLYPPFEAPERNSVWQADHFELPMDVIADGCTTTTVKPWLTLFEDDKTRKVMAWSITATPGRHPDAEVVCATLAAGIRIRIEHGVEVGGVPAIVRWDNDLSFLAGVVLQMGTRVGFECHAVPPYSGHMKGKVERLGRTVQEQFCVLQPGYTHGPRTYTGKDLQRNVELITADELRARLDVWFAQYDARHHTGIDTSPIEAWADDAAPLRRVGTDRLRSALLVDPRKHKVSKRKGVYFRVGYFMSKELVDLTGRTVEVHYPIGPDIDFIEIYKGGKWVCTAWPAKTLSEAERSRIFSGRRDIYDEARSLHDAAARIRQDANSALGAGEATPGVAKAPKIDPLAPDLDGLLDLMARDEGLIGDENDEETGA